MFFFLKNWIEPFYFLHVLSGLSKGYIKVFRSTQVLLSYFYLLLNYKAFRKLGEKMKLWFYTSWQASVNPAGKFEHVLSRPQVIVSRGFENSGGPMDQSNRENSTFIKYTQIFLNFDFHLNPISINSNVK